MKHGLTGLLVLGMFLCFAGMSCGGGGGGGGHHDYYPMGTIGIMTISNVDANVDGVPDDTYTYSIMVMDDTPNNMVDDPPLVTLPDGSTLATGCIGMFGLTVCSTAMQVPESGLKAKIPPGDYSIANNDGLIVAFTVLTDDLLSPDPAYADVDTLSPSSPGLLGDPAVMTWGATAGAAGDEWQFGIENIDGLDDAGQYVGDETDWADFGFTLDLPDNWDHTDPLLVEIVSEKYYQMDGYYQTMTSQILVTGYTLHKP